MAFRKLHFKNVQGTRASQTLQAGELAIDETTYKLYIGDQSTAGGIPVKAETVVPSEQVVDATVPQGGVPGYAGYGNAPGITLTDDTSYEIIRVTNTTGAVAVLDLPNLTASATGKEVLIYSNATSANAVGIYYTRPTFSSGDSLSVVGGNNGVARKMIWLGTYWRYTTYN